MRAKPRGRTGNSVGNATNRIRFERQPQDGLDRYARTRQQDRRVDVLRPELHDPRVGLYQVLPDERYCVCRGKIAAYRNMRGRQTAARRRHAAKLEELKAKKRSIEREIDLLANSASYELILLSGNYPSDDKIDSFVSEFRIHFPLIEDEISEEELQFDDLIEQ